MDKLQQKIDELERENAELKKQLGQKKKLFSDLSREKIDQTVEKLLNNENVNIKYFPDAIERQIYRNVFKIMLGVLDSIAENTSFDFMGHQLTMNLAPKDRLTV